MPQTAAAKKALRVAQHRQEINDRWRTKLHFLERKFAKAVADQNAETARTVYHDLQSTLDRLARRHILHRNTAARVKSRAAAALQRASRVTTESA